MTTTIFEALITKRINNEQLSEIISNILDISSQDILTINNICDRGIAVNDNIKILVENDRAKGDFSTRICIYFRKLNFKDIKYSEEQFFRKLSQLLKCKCLISDDTNNPFTWILLDNNDKQSVYLIPKYLDREIYIIAT